MNNPESMPPAERRAAIRRQFSAKGWFLNAGGKAVDIRTFDASSLGFGIIHSEPLSPVGQLRLAWLDANGPTSVDAEVHVRNTVIARGGELRSGVLIATMSAQHRNILEAHLAGRPSRPDSTSAAAMLPKRR